MDIDEILRQLDERQRLIAKITQISGLANKLNAMSTAKLVQVPKLDMSPVIKQIDERKLAFSAFHKFAGFAKLSAQIERSNSFAQMAQKVSTERDFSSRFAAYRKQIHSSMSRIQSFTNVMMKAAHNVEDVHRTTLISYAAIRDDLPAIDEQLSNIDPVVHAALAEYVVDEQTESQTADTSKPTSPFEPLVTDLKRNPWFPGLVFYVGMTFTATVGSFVAGECQENYKDMRNTLLSFWVFREMFGYCKDSLDRFDKSDDEKKKRCQEEFNWPVKSS